MTKAAKVKDAKTASKTAGFTPLGAKNTAPPPEKQPDAITMRDIFPPLPRRPEAPKAPEPLSAKAAAPEPEKPAKDVPVLPPAKPQTAPPAAKEKPKKPKPKPAPRLSRPPPPTFPTARAWYVTATLDELRQACGQDVELVQLDACDPDTCERVHVMVVNPIHQDRYHRLPGDLLCRIHRPGPGSKVNDLLPSEEDVADCEYCLRKPPRIERRRQMAAFRAENPPPPKPKKEKKKKQAKKKAKKIKDIKEKANV